MKKIAVVFALILILSGCSSTSDDVYKETSEEMNEETKIEVTEEQDMEQKAEYRVISAEEAKEMMTDDVLILDVRSQSEYHDGHIANSELLPHDMILAGELGPIESKDQVVLIYCRSGNRSGQAARYLVEQGYTAIYDFGGIIDWPYEIVK